MKLIEDIIPVFMRYGFKILPETRNLHMLSRNLAELCNPNEKRSLTAFESCVHTYDIGALPCFLLAQLPVGNTEGVISFALSVLSILELLEHYRHSKDISDEMEIRRLYSCFACAVDPSRNSVCPMIHSIKNETRPGAPIGRETTAQTCLSDRCRLQLAVLPSFKLVAPKLKKYAQFYIDLQSYRYYPPLAGVEMLKYWSNGYLQRYHDISWWEFCAASDSLFGIFVMYAAASIPELSAEEAALLDEACFPWLCGLEALLRSVLHMRANEADGLNFATFYSHLKECEERIIFFADKTAGSFSRLRNGDMYNNMVKAMIGLYLTEPEAGFGMLKLASSCILKESAADRYAAFWKLLRMTGFIKEAIREK